MEAAEQPAPLRKSRSLRCLNIDLKSDFQKSSVPFLFLTLCLEHDICTLYNAAHINVTNICHIRVFHLLSRVNPYSEAFWFINV